MNQTPSINQCGKARPEDIEKSISQKDIKKPSQESGVGPILLGAGTYSTTKRRGTIPQQLPPALPSPQFMVYPYHMH